MARPEEPFRADELVFQLARVPTIAELPDLLVNIITRRMSALILFADRRLWRAKLWERSWAHYPTKSPTASNEKGLHRCKPLIILVRPEGFEPPTPWFVGARSKNEYL
jgi:hypothetical protein